jgi:hypothetical protein
MTEEEKIELRKKMENEITNEIQKINDEVESLKNLEKNQ